MDGRAVPAGARGGQPNAVFAICQCVPSWLTVQAECTVAHCYGPPLLLGLGVQAQARAIEDLRSLDKPTFCNDYTKMLLDHFRDALRPDGIYSCLLYTSPSPRDRG